jgi:Asp-tRNA(Asn)/Glu-tRNA(Gln) amidotransferase A subunit family amidase
MSRDFDPARASLTELCAALRARSISAVELMTHTLDALDRTRESLRAVVSRLPSDALMTAAHAAQGRIDRGDARPLEGVPLGVKDLEDAAGLVTSYGSKIFAEHVAASDSTQVARLKAAGAIVVGKTNTPEFGHTVLTKNLVHGTTHSPWDASWSPGGSSGGSAAALAAGVLPLVTASDGGGSIRVPASFCGCFGLKPTHGRVPMGPAEMWDPSATAVYGPLTKTVGDAALILDQVVGIDPRDIYSLPTPGFRYVDRLAEPIGSRLRMAYSPDFGRVPVQTDVAESVEQAVGIFRELGHTVTRAQGGPPDLGIYWGLSYAQFLDSWIGERIANREADVTRTLVRWMEGSRATTPAEWGRHARARTEVVEWFARLFTDCDVLLTPAVPCDPPAAGGPLPTHIGNVELPAGGLAAFTMPISFACLPAATVRAGLSRAGLPVGLQIVGPRGSDDLVLRVARVFEERRPWHPNWPVFSR